MSKRNLFKALIATSCAFVFSCSVYATPAKIYVGKTGYDIISIATDTAYAEAFKKDMNANGASGIYILDDNGTSDTSDDKVVSVLDLVTSNVKYNDYIKTSVDKLPDGSVDYNPSNPPQPPVDPSEVTTDLTLQTSVISQLKYLKIYNSDALNKLGATQFKVKDLQGNYIVSNATNLTTKGLADNNYDLGTYFVTGESKVVIQLLNASGVQVATGTLDISSDSVTSVTFSTK